MRRPYEGLVSNPTLQDFREKATLMRLAPLAESRLYKIAHFNLFSSGICLPVFKKNRQSLVRAKTTRQECSHPWF